VRGNRPFDKGNQLGFKHGYAAKIPEYQVWCDLKHRCLNPKATNYHRYGGRGITVSPEWLNDFAAFYAYVGPRPSPDHSIDRIDNDGNYEPGNVRWATYLEQNDNRSITILLTVFGKKMNLTDAAKAVGLKRTALAARLRDGWSEEEALMTPRMSRHESGKRSAIARARKRTT
jgi:hypothetical protein